jgi:ComF family protein
MLSFLWRAAPAAARAILPLLADALSPAGCAACDAPITRHHVFCPACARTVVRAGSFSPAAPGLTASHAFSNFGGAVATALKRFKYESRPDLARPLGHLLRRAARDADLRAALVVPVPLHPRRIAERGYNQAALLAAAVASELNALLLPRALARVRNTPQQAQLDRRGRLQNVASAFCVLRPEAVRGRRVALIDDVMTTGATLGACAEALLSAGAESVTGLVVARAEADAPRPAVSMCERDDRPASAA